MEYRHLPLLLRERFATYANKTALRYKDPVLRTWQSVSYRQMGEAIDILAKSLLAKGIAEQEMVGIFSRNMPEWTYSDYALMSIRAISVPFYPSDSAAQAAYIIRETNMKLIFVGEQDQYDVVQKVISETGIQLNVVVFDQSTDVKGYEHALYFSEFMKYGWGSEYDNALESRLSDITSEDIATVLYTSGTTGEPKGVVLRYKNIANTIRIHDIYLNNIDENDISLSFLPLSHIFERAWTMLVYHHGMQNNYLRNPREILEAMQEVKPTIMCAVPRFFEKTYNVIQEKLKSYSPVKRRVFLWAIGVGEKRMQHRQMEQKLPLLDQFRYFIANRLVLEKGRNAFGGRIRLMPCAGAMLPDHINIFFHSVGIHIIYAYGLTETLATVAAFPHTRFKFGTVGLPLPDVEIKIGEDNEILIKGGSVFSEYYNKPEETSASFVDGWFKTGDAGEIDTDGHLIMKERIKDLIKTSLGKFVAPQQIECVLCNDPLIEQVMVLGNDRNYITALIVPSFPLVEEFAREHGIAFSSKEELLRNPKVNHLFEERITAIQQELAPYQQVKKFRLLPKEFTIDSGEFTSTLKVKRKVVAQKYKALIDEMYQED